jgi:hypothetical protein
LAAAALLIAVIATHSHARAPSPSRQLPASAAAPAPRAPDGVRPEVLDEPAPETATRQARQARAAHRPRLGTNKAPLIE